MYWEKCSVTGYDNIDFLIASQIKPWRDSTPDEALDMTKRLLLSPNLDRVFDRGFISFKSSGHIILSRILTEQDIHHLSLSKNMKIFDWLPQHESFMSYHRSEIFMDDT